jgi:hypothetical protein
MSVGNLGPAETRKRMTFGAVMLAIGFALAAAMFFLRIRDSWLLVTVLPFWLGSLGLLQGRQNT